MVRIICTGPAQEWPSDDSDFDEENLPGYRPRGKSKRKSDGDGDDDDDADSDYSDSEDAPVKKKKKTSKRRVEKAKDTKDRGRKHAVTRTTAAQVTSAENARCLTSYKYLTVLGY